MAYLSKQSLINALKCIKSTEINVPVSSFSAIQYFIALDRYYYQKEKELKNKSSEIFVDEKASFICLKGNSKDAKKEFISYVTDVITLDDGNYLKSFKELYIGSKAINGTVQSNFFGGSSVDVSQKSPNNAIDYPQQGKPLFYALNGDVYRKEEYYDNFLYYLPTTESRLALAVWLMRKDVIQSLSLEDFRKNLDNKYTTNFIDILLPSESSIFDEFIKSLVIELDENLSAISKNDVFNEKIENTECCSRQIIYYGAPGTGKSNKIKRLTKEAEKEERVFRTTFHPDSDYSTFVGAYKPKMENGKIIYAFEPQTFTNAYVEAWNTDKKIFLIIEEINRGNCAQIFGDIFQLLDRKDDVSEYNIKADSSLADYLRGKIKDRPGIPSLVREGKELKLPSNLYIWATMNTSDQSLFPIDSAFKRRWDWEYIKIAKGKDRETKKDLDWKVDFEYVDEEKKYHCSFDWWEFIQKINDIIASATSSDDKKLGYFFCQIKKNKDGNEIIDAKTFVGKVVFYLWNDVLKEEKPELFKVYSTKGEPSFDAFYKEDENGETIVDTLALRDFAYNVFGENNIIVKIEVLEKENNENKDDKGNLVLTP